MLAKEKPSRIERNFQLTVSGEERDSRSIGTSSASTANTVNIILRVVGVVVVQHMCDVANILIRVSRRR